MDRLDAVALGELLIDFTMEGADEAGYPTMAAHPGGAPANFLAAMAKFGGRTALLGKVGDDAFGALLHKTLEQAGIGTAGLVTDGAVFTTLAFVTLDERGDRDFSFARKPGADTALRPEEVDPELIDRARVFHFGTLSLTHEPARSATQKAVEYARKTGKIISFDPNLRLPLWEDPACAREQMLWGLEQADVVKISREEVGFLFALAPREGGAHILDRFGAKLVFVTCGEDGCFYRNPQNAGHVPALKGLRVVDTTGAGDIFGGSAAWAMLQTGKAPEELEGEELERIVRFATAAAGLSTTKPGGISSVPEYEAVIRAIQ